MDGNHSRLPRRLERATGVIALDIATVTSLWRYLRRSRFERERQGALEGGRDSVIWTVIRHIAVTQLTNRKRNAGMFGRIALAEVRFAHTSPPG